MKKNELRIGNYIRGKSDPEKRISPAGIVCIEGSDLFEGVPLTEEWLIKFGFERQPFDHENNKDYKLGNIFIQEHTEVNDFICCNTSPDFIKIEHVHQLQNLYFVLTGEELTIK